MNEVSVVLPTYNRAAALRRNLPRLLAVDGVAEVVVVDDGSTDDTPRLLARVGDPRVRVLRRRRNGGAPAARNLGAAAASGDWVLFAEDDCRFPGDFATVLLDEARRHGADIVSAPMVHVRDEAELPEVVAAARATPGTRGLDHVAGFPSGPTLTPLLPAPALVRASVLRAVRFDEGYGGTAYREETDFFIRACRAGFVCVLTPRTFFWEERRFPGGQARPLPSRAYWKLRNNARLLRRHGTWLREEGIIGSPWGEQARFVGRRGREQMRSLVRRARELAPVTLSPNRRRGWRT